MPCVPCGNGVITDSGVDGFCMSGILKLTAGVLWLRSYARGCRGGCASGRRCASATPTRGDRQLRGDIAHPGRCLCPATSPSAAIQRNWGTGALLLKQWSQLEYLTLWRTGGAVGCKELVAAGRKRVVRPVFGGRPFMVSHQWVSVRAVAALLHRWPHLLQEHTSMHITSA